MYRRDGEGQRRFEESLQDLIWRRHLRPVEVMVALIVVLGSVLVWLLGHSISVNRFLPGLLLPLGFALYHAQVRREFEAFKRTKMAQDIQAVPNTERLSSEVFHRCLHPNLMCGLLVLAWLLLLAPQLHFFTVFFAIIFLIVGLLDRHRLREYFRGVLTSPHWIIGRKAWVWVVCPPSRPIRWIHGFSILMLLDALFRISTMAGDLSTIGGRVRILLFLFFLLLFVVFYRTAPRILHGEEPP